MLFLSARSAAVFMLLAVSSLLAQPSSVVGHLMDPQGKAVSTGMVRVKRGQTEVASAKTDSQGIFSLNVLPAGNYELKAEAPGFVAILLIIDLSPGHAVVHDLQFRELASQSQSIVITGKSLGGAKQSTPGMQH